MQRNRSPAAFLCPELVRTWVVIMWFVFPGRMASLSHSHYLAHLGLLQGCAAQGSDCLWLQVLGAGAWECPLVVGCCLAGGCTHVSDGLGFCMLACMGQRNPCIEVGSILWQTLHFVAVIEPLSCHLVGTWCCFWIACCVATMGSYICLDWYCNLHTWFGYVCGEMCLIQGCARAQNKLSMGLVAGRFPV